MQPTPTRSPTAKSRHLGADCGDDARDLVAGDHREDRSAPLVADLVDVAMADAAVRDVDLHVPRAQLATLDRRPLERSARRGRAQGWRCGHAVSWGRAWTAGFRFALNLTAPAWSAQLTGGGTPSPLLASVESQSHTEQACRNAERANCSAKACGSSAARTSSQSSTYSPSSASQRAAAGSSSRSAKPARRRMRVGVEGGAAVALVAGPPADRDLLRVHRVAHDEVLRGRVGRAAREEVDREVERAPPGVHGRRAPAVGGAERAEHERRLRRGGEVLLDLRGVVARVLVVLVQRDAPRDLLRRERRAAARRRARARRRAPRASPPPRADRA